jgi:hypothetical protein
MSSVTNHALHQAVNTGTLHIIILACPHLDGHFLSFCCHLYIRRMHTIIRDASISNCTAFLTNCTPQPYRPDCTMPIVLQIRGMHTIIGDASISNCTVL